MRGICSLNLIINIGDVKMKSRTVIHTSKTKNDDKTLNSDIMLAPFVLFIFLSLWLSDISDNLLAAYIAFGASIWCFICYVYLVWINRGK